MIPCHTDSGAGLESDGGILDSGFDSVSVVGFLAGFDPSGLDDDGLVQVMVEAQRVVAAAQVVQVKAMAELSRRRPRTFGHPFGEFVADEVALELCLTRRAAENLLGQATAAQVATDVAGRVERQNTSDGKCRFPSCPRSAQHADLDHTIPLTWQLTQDNGRFCWTSPTGRHYITEPENHDPP